MGSMIGSMKYSTPHRSSVFTLGSSVSMPSPKLGITTTRVPVAGELAHDVEIGVVDTEHETRTGVDGCADLRRIKRVDTHPHPGGDEGLDDVAQRGEG